jgi:hypothetical protein
MLNLQVFLKQGPYGYYVQVGEDKKGLFPKRVSLSKVIIAISFSKLKQPYPKCQTANSRWPFVKRLGHLDGV